MVDVLEARHSATAPVVMSPVLRLLQRGATSLFDTVRPAADTKGTPRAGPDPTLDAIFVLNIRSISAINRQRSVRTIWIGEVFHGAPPPPDASPHLMWAPFVDLMDLPRLLAHFRGLLRQEALALDDILVEADTSSFDNTHFVDGEHFSAKSAPTFATKVAPAIARACGSSE